MTRFSKRNGISGRRHSKTRRPTEPAASAFRYETLEARQMLTGFTAGDLAVLQLASTSNNTTGAVLDVSPSIANQSSPVSFAISPTGTNAIRFSDSGTSGFLSDTNDGSELSFAAYNTSDTTDSNLATVTANDPAGDRAVATLDAGGNFVLQTHYTGTSGNQARSATSLDNSNWFISDKGGLYTNGATSASLTTNILDTRSFGGTVYVSSTSAAAGVSTVSGPTAHSLSGLPGLASDSKIQDFYLIQSGSNGSTFDVLYTLDQGSTNATINKFSLVGGSWVANGSYTVTGNATSMIAENDGNSGAYLYVVTTAQAADNSVVRLTDTTGWVNNSSPTTGFTLSGSTTLYTATGTSTLKGIAFAPAASTAPTVASPTSTSVGINVATLGGTVTRTGSGVSGTTSTAVVSDTVSGYGVVYSPTSVNSTPIIGGTGVVQVAGSGTAIFNPFTVSASGLQANTAYSYAAYATNSAGTSYSYGTFTTSNANPPSIDTPTDASITATSAVLGGTVESSGGAGVQTTATGIVYALTSVNGNPQLNGTGVTELDTGSPVNSGAFTLPVAGLTPGAHYTFEAFATNGSGTTYTSATSFTTLAAPSVTSPTVAAVTGTSATLGGSVTSDGGSPVTTRGVVYAPTSVNGNPQIGGTGVTEMDAAGPQGNRMCFSVQTRGECGLAPARSSRPSGVCHAGSL